MLFQSQFLVFLRAVSGYGWSRPPNLPIRIVHSWGASLAHFCISVSRDCPEQPTKEGL